VERSIRELDMRGSATSPLRDFASHLVEALHELGVSTIILGYPLKVVTGQGQRVHVKRLVLPQTVEYDRVGCTRVQMKMFKVVEYNALNLTERVEG
jgi:hypothetical protein